MSKNNKNEEDWISSGDLCWFYDEQRAHPADQGSWEYSSNILRIFSPLEPLVYVRQVQGGNNGERVHHIECLGLSYVFKGPYKSFTKQPPSKRGFAPGSRVVSCEH